MSYYDIVKEALDNAYSGEYQKAIELYEEAFKEQVELNDYANYAICLQAVKNYEKAETVLFEILEYSEGVIFLLSRTFTATIFSITSPLNKQVLNLRFQKRVLHLF
jgi:tetratricopeptide (TPR) repeat protein